MELITRKWNDINRKVQSAGLWGLITVVVAGALRATGIDADAGVVVNAIQDTIEAVGPLVPIVAGYMTRETKN